MDQDQDDGGGLAELRATNSLKISTKTKTIGEESWKLQRCSERYAIDNDALKIV